MGVIFTSISYFSLIWDNIYTKILSRGLGVTHFCQMTDRSPRKNYCRAGRKRRASERESATTAARVRAVVLPFVISASLTTRADARAAAPAARQAGTDGATATALPPPSVSTATTAPLPPSATGGTHCRLHPAAHEMHVTSDGDLLMNQHLQNKSPAPVARAESATTAL